MSKTITKQNNLTEVRKSVDDVLSVCCCLEFMGKNLSKDPDVDILNDTMGYLLQHFADDLGNSYGILSDFMNGKYVSISTKNPRLRQRKSGSILEA